MGTRKISVTVEEDLVDALQGRVGTRGVSRFVTRAIRHELERDELGDLLAELEAQLGPPDERLVAEAVASFDRAERGGKARSSRRRR
jgi:hypothetical protein